MSNRQINWKKQEGFTLIELLIVVGLIVVLSALVLPQFLDFNKRAELNMWASRTLEAIKQAQSLASANIQASTVELSSYRVEFLDRDGGDTTDNCYSGFQVVGEVGGESVWPRQTFETLSCGSYIYSPTEKISFNTLNDLPSNLSSTANIRICSPGNAYREIEVDLQGRVNLAEIQTTGVDANCDCSVSCANLPQPTPQQNVVSVYAAGTHAKGVYPHMRLEVSGTTVGGWYVTGELKYYSYTTTDSVQPGDVRVYFDNDRVFYPKPGVREDRNLRVDYLQINGDVYQTEAAKVFSTGTYTRPDGCDDGRKESEWLHCNGFFEYSN